VLHQPIDTLSKGFKRRVGLAQALLHDPDVLILDEPTDGLDPNQKHEVRRLISEIAAEKAIIISTHILEEVDAVCTRAIIIARGRVLADATPAELEARSRYHNAVRLELDPELTAAARQELLQVPLIADVDEIDDDEGRALMVFPRDGHPIVAEIGDLLRARGWEARGFRVERGRLDDVFRHITTRHDETTSLAA
jgi:ABC-2 type transport system ATP-binding protein